MIEWLVETVDRKRLAVAVEDGAFQFRRFRVDAMTIDMVGAGADGWVSCHGVTRSVRAIRRKTHSMAVMRQ